MPTAAFLRGLLLGFSIAAPVGPIGVLCIRRTLADGRLTGLVSGLGAACADAVYGTIAAFGLTAVARLLIGQQLWLGLLGGLFLCYLGVQTARAKPAAVAAARSARSLSAAFASTFLLTLTNPLTILAFAAVFAGLGLAETVTTGATAAALVGGVFLGSALWWLLLSSGVSLARQRVTPGLLLWINRAAGAVILLFGLAAVVRALAG